MDGAGVPSAIGYQQWNVFSTQFFCWFANFHNKIKFLR
jgi:hypothetical protein